MAEISTTRSLSLASSPRDRAASFAELVRDALDHLYDVPFLQTHPLGAHVRASKDASGKSGGHSLQVALRDAIAAFGADNRQARSYQVLQLRYVEALDVSEACVRLGIGRTEFYRNQRVGLAALVALLQDRWAVAASSGPSTASLLAIVRNSELSPPRLPQPLTRLIGRDPEVASIGDQLGSHRLVTLTGPGGVGKSRLGLAVAARLQHGFADGVWLVQLAQVSDPNLVASAVADRFDLREVSHEPILTTLIRMMLERQLLLLLDNCEQVIAGCASCAEAILQSCPGVRIVVTSREPLGISGEVVRGVPPLVVPSTDHPLAPERLAEVDSVRLFVERVRATRPEFTLTDANAPATARLCARLDGIPLAIELAAARRAVVSVEQIASRLDDRFALLTTGSRTGLPRHQTLRATVDWSYDLLSDPEQALFRRVSVFDGPWSLEAAEQVGPDAVPDGLVRREQVLDLLGRLVSRSLVQATTIGGETCYQLLETLRAYGRDRLAESGEAEATYRVHLAWCLDLAEEIDRTPVIGKSRVAAMERVSGELANVQAALGWCLEHDVEAGLRLAGKLFWLWFSRYVVEGGRWLIALLDRSPAETPSRAKCLAAAGFLVARGGDFARGANLALEGMGLDQSLGSNPSTAMLARWMLAMSAQAFNAPEQASRICEVNLDLCRRTGEQWGVGLVCWQLGLLEQSVGNRARAAELLGHALAVYRETEDGPLTGDVLMMLGDLARLEGHYRSARGYLEESILLAQAAANREGLSWALAILGNVARAEGSLSEAEELLAESRRYYDEFGAKPSWSPVLGWWGNLARLQGRVGEARRRFRSALELLGGGGNPRLVAEILCFLGILAAREGDDAPAACLLGAALGLRPLLRNELDPGEGTDFDSGLALAMERLGADAYAREWSRGQAMTLDQAIAYALSAI